MTKEEQNIKVDGFISKRCRHTPAKIPDAYGVEGCYCTKCQSEGDLTNPDYLTMNGIGLIKEWLEKEIVCNDVHGSSVNRWFKFKSFIQNQDLRTFELINIATDPEKFIPKFIEYMEQ